MLVSSWLSSLRKGLGSCPRRRGRNQITTPCMLEMLEKRELMSVVTGDFNGDGYTDLAFGNPDWIQLARAFGWNGYRVDNSRDLPGLLSNAFQEAGPSLVVIPIDYRENALLTKRLGNIACPI